MSPTAGKHQPTQHPDDLWNELRRHSLERRQQSLAEKQRQNEIEMAMAKEMLSRAQSTTQPHCVPCRIQTSNSARVQTPSQLRHERTVSHTDTATSSGPPVNERTGVNGTQTVRNLVVEDEKCRILQPDHKTAAPQCKSFHNDHDEVLEPVLLESACDTISTNTRLIIPPIRSRVNPSGNKIAQAHVASDQAQKSMPPFSPDEKTETHPIWGPMRTDHAVWTHVQRSWSDPLLEPTGTRFVDIDNRVSYAGDGSHVQGQINGATTATTGEGKDERSLVRPIVMLNSEGIYRRRCAELGYGGMIGVGCLYRPAGLCQSCGFENCIEKDRDQGVSGSTKREKIARLQEEDVSNAVGWLKNMNHMNQELKGWCGVSGVAENGTEGGGQEEDKEIEKVNGGNDVQEEDGDNHNGDSWNESYTCVSDVGEGKKTDERWESWNDALRRFWEEMYRGGGCGQKSVNE